jgi:hypothetical protein|tara:strand:+ start:339 stop:1001 length:663 start_codon:yes stop_codon:yes gene_type:complete
MWKTFSLTSLVVSTILACPVNQSHGFGLGETLKSLKEGLTTTANCIETFDSSAESTSITCTPKNSQQEFEQTQQQTQKAQQQEQQPASQQTQQQAQKPLPRTPINCKEQEHIWNGKVNRELKKLTHQYSIDHDEKRLRSIGENRPWRKWRKVLEFSDHLIRVERINEKKNRVDTLTINRVNGRFDERRVISNERALKLFGKPGVLEVSGSCKKIDVTPKF